MSKSHRLIYLSMTIFFLENNLTFGLKAYVQSGDINLGAIIPIGQTGDDCRPLRRSVRFWYTAQAIVYAVNKINENEKLLSGITLGFAILDGCTDLNTTMQQASRFYPPPLSTENRNKSDGFDVVGVIAGVASDASQALNDLFSRKRIPQLSYWATSDTLNSNHYLYSYFLRIVPHNFMQMNAIVKFMARQGWSYFSVMYGKNSYGISSLKSIKHHILSYSMCIDTAYELASDSNYTQIIENLVNSRSRARVVILVGNYPEMERTFQTVQELGAQKKLIWIGTDGWAGKVNNLHPYYRQSFLGSFTTAFYAPEMTDFRQYLDTLKPSSSKDPWLQDIWKQVFNCSSGQEACNETLKMSDSGFYIVYAVGYAADAVFAFAQALDKLIRDKCKGRVGSAAAICVKDFAQGVEDTCTTTPKYKGPCDKDNLMLPYLKSVSFEGFTGLIEFDEDGNRHGQAKFTIKQIVQGRDNIQENPVRVVDGTLSGVFHKVGRITWEYVEHLTKFVFEPDARLAKTGYEENDSLAPASVCSRLCEWGEHKIIKIIGKDCCWDCRPCQPNEKRVPNSTECQPCPEFYWPEESTNFTTCILIKLHFKIFSNVLMPVVVFMSSVGLSITIAAIVCFIIYRRNRIIKASSRELSAIQLLAILTGFISNVLFIIYPALTTCKATYLLICLSYSALFTSMLMKNIRIYRLFRAAAQGKRDLKAVKPFSQIIIFLVLMAVQCVISGILIAEGEIRAQLSQPKPSVKYVEMHCYFGIAEILTFIIWNLVLIFLCALSAYKIRTVPRTFHESINTYIILLTASIIWISIIIFRITLNGKHIRIAFFGVLSAIYLLVALVCIYVNRMFLVMFGSGRAHGSFAVQGLSSLNLKPKEARHSRRRTRSTSRRQLSKHHSQNDSTRQPSKHYSQNGSTLQPSKHYGQNDSTRQPSKHYGQNGSTRQPSKHYSQNDSTRQPSKHYGQNDSTRQPSKHYNQNGSTQQSGKNYSRTRLDSTV